MVQRDNQVIGNINRKIYHNIVQSPVRLAVEELTVLRMASGYLRDGRSLVIAISCMLS